MVDSRGQGTEQKDFLCSFESRSHCSGESGVSRCGEDSGAVELNLGLSLGGRFGVEKKLKRSVSLATIPPPAWAMEKAVERPVIAPPLIRTISLPAVIDEERRKRKEMQSLKRLEVKRKILERKNCLNSTAASAPQQSVDDRNDPSASRVFRSSSLPRELQEESRKRRKTQGLSTSEAKRRRTREMQGSVSRISGESNDAIARPDSKSFHVHDAESYRPPGVEAAAFCKQTRNGNVSAEICAEQRNSKEAVSARSVVGRTLSIGAASEPNMIDQDMPFVSTTGDGPNGRRIEGFLYKYRKGEELKIVCVCHGSFLTPAEFVRHAGGGNVAHPLKRIVMNKMPARCLS